MKNVLGTARESELGELFNVAWPTVYRVLGRLGVNAATVQVEI